MRKILDFMNRYYRAKPEAVLQIGANSGGEALDMQAAGIERAIFVEPLERPYSKLKARIKDMPGYIPVQACLSDQSGREVSFHVASNQGASSSYLEPKREMIAQWAEFNEVITLVTRTLDDLMAEVPDRDVFDMIMLDTQGTELEILRGGQETLARAEWVYTEVSNAPQYCGAPDTFEVISDMRAYGFQMVHVLINRNGWGDALFKRG